MSAGFELSVRHSSPSKRVRRHATGASNQDSENSEKQLLRNTAPHTKTLKLTIDDKLIQGSLTSSEKRTSELPAIRQIGESTLRNGYVTKVPDNSINEVLTETRKKDRHTISKVYDTVCVNNRTSWVRKVFRAYDSDKSGVISCSQMRTVLDRLRCGLSSEEKDRVIYKMDQEGSGSIQYDKMFDVFGNLNPLGDHLNEEQLERFGLDNNVQVKKPWEERRGEFVAWKPAPAIIAGVSNSADPGSYEEQKEDMYLMGLVRGKLNQHKDKLRLLFRQMDFNRNSLIDKHEFSNAIQALRMHIAKPQIERLFDLADKDLSGSIDYEEFIKTFEGQDTLNMKLKTNNLSEKTLAETYGLEATEISKVFRNPLIFELRRRLYSKAALAHNVFKQFDLNGDGFLSVDELSKCCSILVPGIERRDVAAIMVKVDQTGDGYLDYREFIKSLVEDGPPNQASVDVHLRREENPEMIRNGWGQSPVWTRPMTPTRCSSPQHSGRVSASKGDLVHQTALEPVVTSLDSSLRDISQPDVNRVSSSPLYTPRTVSKLSQSLDLSSLRHQDPVIPRSTNPLSKSDRFWSLKHLDTRHIVQADTFSDHFLPLDKTFMRKTDVGFNSYQTEDDHKKQVHQNTGRIMFSKKIQLAQSDPQVIDYKDQGRLAARTLLKSRYMERLHMYDEARKAGSQGAYVFGRLNIYHEHEPSN